MQFWTYNSVLFQYWSLWVPSNSVYSMNMKSFSIDLFGSSVVIVCFSFLPLRTVIWDKNNITAQGFQDIAVALEK